MSSVRVFRKRRASRGETLIEAMISLAIMSIGLLGILQMNGLASQQSGVARRETIAATLARDLVDAFERLPFNHPALVPSGTAYTDPTFVDPNNTDGLQEFATTWAGARPLMGATDAVMAEDISAGLMRVMWRTQVVDASMRIAIMVTYPGPNGSQKQLTVWTTKPNMVMVIGGTRGGIPEI